MLGVSSLNTVHGHGTGEAHHVDYSKPFLVGWCCPDCHREVERGIKRFTRWMLWDYSSLVRVRIGARREARKVVPLRTGTDDVPF